MNLWRRANLVLPNSSSIGLCGLLLAMWYAGASQNNGAAYLLCFVVASLTLLSIPHAWANLRGVCIQVGPIRPVFVGEKLVVPVSAKATTRRRHFGLHVAPATAGTPVVFSSISEGNSAEGQVLIDPQCRGVFTSVGLRLTSTFPLGFFTAHRWVEVFQEYVVYPEPVGELALPITTASAQDTPSGARIEGDDFAGVREWIPGESMRQIDWKAVSRGLPLMTKQWTNHAGHRLVLDWSMIAGGDVEPKLSQLSRWVLDAERRGYSYSLKLPGHSIESGSGSTHFHKCLKALAAFPRQ